VIGCPLVAAGRSRTETPLTIKRFAVLLVKYTLLLAALVVTAGVSALTTMRAILTSQEVQVPALIGRRITEAGILAERQRLSVRVEGRRHDAKVPADRIAAQEPPPGSTLKSHRSIRVWISLGARRLTVPQVEGDSLRSARLTPRASASYPKMRFVSASTIGW